eukprot:3926070-Pleurochrysis_carterae.AAC.1
MSFPPHRRHALLRVPLAEIAEMQPFVAADEVSASALRISTTFLFERHTLMAPPRREEGVRRWLRTLRAAVAAVKAAAAKKPKLDGAPDVAGCLGVERADEGPARHLHARGGGGGGGGADSALVDWGPSAPASCHSSGCATRTAVGASWPAGESVPWASHRLSQLVCSGFLEKRRDGLLLVGW